MTTYDPRLRVYFGDGALASGFMPTPNLFLRHYHDLGLTAAQAMFLLQLMAGTWDAAAPPRTTADLARRMGVDSRTIRGYVEAICQLGLLRPIRRYDAAGRQRENSYDLSELFARLAALAPDHAPAPRATTPLEQDIRIERSVALDPSILQEADPVGQPEADGVIQEGRTDRSALNQEEAKNLNQEEMNGAGAHMRTDEQHRSEPEQPAGWSMRWQVPLDSAEVARSANVLRHLGIDRPFRDALAAGLAPPEAWALATFATARGWRAGLVVCELYDTDERRPRAARNLEAAHDAVGRLLDALDAEAAEDLLARVGRHCPLEPAPIVAHLSNADEELRSAARALWSIVATLRGAPGKLLPMPEPAAPATTDPCLDATWQTACAILEERIAGDAYRTWIEPATLVALDEGQAILAVPNLLVRDALRCEHLPALESALAAACGTPLAVVLVIDPQSAARSQRTQRDDLFAAAYGGSSPAQQAQQSGSGGWLP